MLLSPEHFVVWWCVIGLIVGSFLNVAIHRWPLEDETVRHPKRSRCPSCRNELGWKENIPLFSWIAQLGRCRSCGWRIPVRYPLVEASNAGLWLLAAWLSPGQVGLVVFQSIVVSGLLVATFVDFDRFEIPDEVSIGGMILAPIASLLVPALHRSTWLARELSEGDGVDRVGALVGSLAGVAVGGGILLGIGYVGRLAFGRDAMGLGDVKLLAAGGGFVGPGGALAALFLGSIVASFVGLFNLIRFTLVSQRRARARGSRKSLVRSLQVARIGARYLPFGPYLGLGIGIALFAWEDVEELLREFVFLAH